MWVDLADRTDPARILSAPLANFTGWITTTFGAIGLVGTVAGTVGKVSIKGGLVIFGHTVIGAAGTAGTLAGPVAALAVIALVFSFAHDRCIEGEGLTECIAGVVREIIGSFSSFRDELFPFSAIHDRVDVVVKSRF